MWKFFHKLFIRWLCWLTLSPPKNKNEHSWSEFLERMNPDDRRNVKTICNRVQELVDRSMIPLAIMGVGSVLTKDGDYNDVDLRLIPILDIHRRRAGGPMVKFITTQPEIVVDKRDEPVYRKWYEGLHMYDYSIMWWLEFPQGKPVNMFILTRCWSETLRSKVINEADYTGYLNRPFCYKTFYPS
jgi:hypothetical protein